MAVKIGADGILESNHGGRNFEAAPPAVDCGAGGESGGRRPSPPCCSTPGCAPGPMSRAGSRSARRRRSAGRPSSGAWRPRAEGGGARDRPADRRDGSALGQIGAQIACRGAQRQGSGIPARCTSESGGCRGAGRWYWPEVTGASREFSGAAYPALRLQAAFWQNRDTLSRVGARLG